MKQKQRVEPEWMEVELVKVVARTIRTRTATYAKIEAVAIRVWSQAENDLREDGIIIPAFDRVLDTQAIRERMLSHNPN